MKKLTFALAGITALVLGTTTRAEPTAPATDKPAAVAAALTDESLAKMLTDMGYEFKVVPGNAVIYRVTLAQDGWTFYLNVALSTDKQQLWITSPVATLTEESVPAAALLRLLEENNNIGPSAIYYDKKSKRISLGLPLFNRGGITPVVFRTYMNDFLVSIKSTVKLCDFAKPAEKTEKAAADAPK